MGQPHRILCGQKLNPYDRIHVTLTAVELVWSNLWLCRCTGQSLPRACLSWLQTLNLRGRSFRSSVIQSINNSLVWSSCLLGKKQEIGNGRLSDNFFCVCQIQGKSRLNSDQELSSELISYFQFHSQGLSFNHIWTFTFTAKSWALTIFETFTICLVSETL